MGLRIKGVFFNQHGVEFLIGYARAADILKQIKVDEWSPKNPSGYQRRVNERRAREFGHFIVKEGIFPNAVILNIREQDKYNFRKTDDSEYEIADRVTLWVLDGQHRLKGLEYIGINHPAILNIDIPVTITNLKSRNPEEAREKEAAQFLIINKTHRGFRTDLAERILIEAEEKRKKYEHCQVCQHQLLEESDFSVAYHNQVVTRKKEFMVLSCEEAIPFHDRKISRYNDTKTVLPSSLKREMRWKPRAVRISDLLNERCDSPLFGKMKLPNVRPKGATFSQVAMVNSLKNILNTAPFDQLTDEEIASILINFWQAVKDLCPQPFREVEKKMRADDYVLLKTTGIYVIPKLLEGLNTYLPRRNGTSFYTVEIFRRFLSRAGELMQPYFWRTSGSGTAGAMGTGQKSFSKIAEMIISRIIGRGDERGEQKIIL